MNGTTTRFADEQRCLQILYRRMMNSLWMLLTTGKPEWAEQYETDELSYQDFLASDSLRHKVCRMAHSDPSTVTEEEQRIADRLWLEMVEYQGSAALRRRAAARWSKLVFKISSYRARVGGRLLDERELRAALATSEDEAERKALWFSIMRLGDVIAPDLVALVQLRNKQARQAGYRHYHELKLAACELDWALVSDVVTRLKAELDPLYRHVKREVDEAIAKRFAISAGEIRPWHYGHPFLPQLPGEDERVFQAEAEERLLERLQLHFSSIGLSIGPLLSRSDLYSRPGKSPANFCLHLDRAGDVRISCHLQQNGSGLPHLLHELGHALYEQGIDPDLPYALRQHSHPFLSEAAALLFERLSNSPQWLAQLGFTLLQPSERLELAAARQQLLKLYHTMTVVLFEYELYSNPDQPLARRWWELVEEVQGIHPPAEGEVACWAATAHLTTLPVYYQNYLLGEVAASQIEDSLRSRGEQWPGPAAVGRMAERLFWPGATLRWDQLLLSLCGQSLSTVPLVDRMYRLSNPALRDGRP
ncbi:MAG: M2 family metallopeptidase [Brevibacillus sp.]|nr:M2 family metallopeptidase [Brevibacillus sp.]